MADSMKVKETYRMRLTRNGVTLYNQEYSTPTDETYSEHAADRVVLATNMVSPQQASLGGITTGQHLAIKTDRAIKVGVSSQTNLLDVERALVIVGSFTSLWFQNESTTNTATVEFVATD